MNDESSFDTTRLRVAAKRANKDLLLRKKRDFRERAHLRPVPPCASCVSPRSWPCSWASSSPLRRARKSRTSPPSSRRAKRRCVPRMYTDKIEPLFPLQPSRARSRHARRRPPPQPPSPVLALADARAPPPRDVALPIRSSPSLPPRARRSRRASRTPTRESPLPARPRTRRRRSWRRRPPRLRRRRRRRARPCASSRRRSRRRRL
jgi:hypothetical protein